MIDIDKEIIDFDVDPDSDLIIAMAQIPSEWIQDGNLVKHKDPEKQWNLVKQTLERIKEENLYGRTTDIVAFPEWSVPYNYMKELLDFVRGFDSDFILLAGFEMITLEQFVELLNRSDNSEKKNYTKLIEDSTDYKAIKGTKPVNFCSIIVKSGNNVRQYFQSKIAPSTYEQKGSDELEILRGTYLLHFETEAKERLRKFSFIPLICFDQIYEKAEAGSSVIERLIAHADGVNPPDFVFILQCNPKMSHPSIDAALYEYYQCLPNRALRTRTYTLFVNVSDESVLHSEVKGSLIYGSCIVFNKKTKFINTEEYEVIKMDRMKLHKIKFKEKSNRLYFLKCSVLSNYQEDPRSSRTPITVMRTYMHTSGQWKHVMPTEVTITKVDFNELLPMLDWYCIDGLIKYFDDGILGSREVIDELRKNELLVILRRDYERTRKEHIPKKLIEKMEQVLERLDKLEKVKNKKLTEDETDELYTLGASIRQNTEIINHIIKR